MRMLDFIMLMVSMFAVVFASATSHWVVAIWAFIAELYILRCISKGA